MRPCLSALAPAFALLFALAILPGCGDSSEPAAPPASDAVDDAAEGVRDAASSAGDALSRLGESAQSALTVEDAAADATPVNAVCPMSGEAVDQAANKVTFQGKTYGFCCNNCYKAAKEAPEKLAKAISGN